MNYDQDFETGVTVTLAVFLIIGFVSFCVTGVLHTSAVRTLPDGKQYVQLNYTKYWITEWETKR